VLGLSYKKDIDDLRESPSLNIIELLRERGAEVSYNDPFFPKVGRGRHWDLNMTCAPLDDLSQYDCVVIVTDHSAYDYKRIVSESKLVVDTRNATKGIKAPNLVCCWFNFFFGALPGCGQPAAPGLSIYSFTIRSFTNSSPFSFPHPCTCLHLTLQLSINVPA
jgi:hypothetical protein